MSTQWTPDITWGHPMRPRKARRVNRLVVLTAAVIILAAGGMATARADHLYRPDTAYVSSWQQCAGVWVAHGAMGGRLS